MSRPFAKYPAKPAFGQIREPLEAGEYIQSKKTKYSFCAPNICHPNKNVYSQSNLMNLKTAKYFLNFLIMKPQNLENKHIQNTKKQNKPYNTQHIQITNTT